MIRVQLAAYVLNVAIVAYGRIILSEAWTTASVIPQQKLRVYEAGLHE
jgi:hypothetical protein